MNTTNASTEQVVLSTENIAEIIKNLSETVPASPAHHLECGSIENTRKWLGIDLATDKRDASVATLYSFEVRENKLLPKDIALLMGQNGEILSTFKVTTEQTAPRELEIVFKEIHNNRLTLTPTRATLKMPIGTSETDKVQLIKIATLVEEQTRDITQSWRSCILPDAKSVLLNNDHESKHIEIQLV